MKTWLLIIGVIVVLLTALWVLGANRTTSGEIDIDGESVACTLEAKLCSDGSYVGRQGPNCEFAPCPGE